GLVQPDGSFHFDGVSTGTIQIGAQGEHSATHAPVSVTLTAGATKDVELVLVSSTTGHVVVHDASGAAAPCGISLSDDEGRALPLQADGARGEAWLGALTAGHFVVRATPRDKHAERAFDVRGDEEKIELELTLQ